jgi:hypothetical protein
MSASDTMMLALMLEDDGIGSSQLLPFCSMVAPFCW